MSEAWNKTERVMRHPVHFLDEGAVRCLTFDQATALKERLDNAISRARVEIALAHRDDAAGGGAE